MDRKEFIKTAAALGIGLPFLSVLLESCGKENLYPAFDVNFSGKVIIIGAGAAGLMAGYLLHRYNIDFEIIEAAPVYGGRIKKNVGFADFPFDMGGEWIHEDPSVLARLISDETVNANIEILTYTPDTIYNYNNDKLHRVNWGSNFYSEYKFKDQTWYGFFEQYIVPNIFDKIVLNSPVTEIDYSADKVTVTNANNDTFEADKVLVTVPIKILQNESISFVPSLSATKTDAINSVDMPAGLKVFMEFSEKFYPDICFTDKLINLLSVDDKVFYDAAFGKDSNKNILALFTVGEKAAVYTDLGTDEAIFAKVLSELDTIFEGKASQTYIKHIVQNWSAEPFIQGSYSHNITGTESTVINTLLEPVANKIYFAGEALNENNRATVPGAAESGSSVIETILKE